MAITTTNASSIYVDNANTPAELSIGYIKQLKVLLSKRVALMNAQLENITSVNLGTAIYYIGARNLTRNYDGTAGTPETVITRQVVIQLDSRKDITFTVEGLDLLQLGAKLAEDGGLIVSQSFVSSWIDARAKSFEAFIFAKLTQLAVASAVANTVVDLPILTADGTSIDYGTDNINNFLQAELWLPVSNSIALLEAKINQDYVGIDREDLLIICSPRAYNYLLLATATLGSDSARKEALIDFDLTMLMGIKLLKNPMLGTSYAVSTIDKDEAFDFSATDIIVLHKQALAFPYNRGQIATTVQPETANLIFIHKFFVNSAGGSALRPALVEGFKLMPKS